MELGKILCVGWVIESRPDHVQARKIIVPCHVPHPYRFNDRENVCRGKKRDIYAHYLPAIALFDSDEAVKSGHSDNRIENLLLVALANVETVISPKKECEISAAEPLDRFLNTHAAHVICCGKKNIIRPPCLTNSPTSFGVV
jgi:hypothetical protein